MPGRVDLLLIGSGPAAVAALAAAPEGARIAVVTGAVPAAPGTRTHAKIKAVAYERNEPPGLGEMIAFADGGGDRLFSTAAEGGLARYWGQQFVRYGPADPWPQSAFADYGAYLRACTAIESLFRLSPPTEEASSGDGGGYRLLTPRLLVGTPGEDAGLLAMATAFRELATRRRATILPRRAIRFEMRQDAVEAVLDDGGRIEADRVVLAAGVIGSLQIIMASCPDATGAGFRDHTPFMLYTLGAGRLAPVVRSDGLRHFNAMTVERVVEGRTELFASVYRMAHAPLSLLLAAVGFPPLLRGAPAPSLADMVKPIQLWTRSTYAELSLGADGRARVLGRGARVTEDAVAAAFIDWLRSNGVRLTVRESPPGAGFHYHAAELFTGGDRRAVAAFLQERFGPRVACVDASILEEIGCRPHTLTAMATAYALSSAAGGKPRP